MTDRLQKSFDVQGEFVANASHELKTPMAVLMTNIETALMNKKISTDTRDYLETSLGTIQNMNVLVEDLLLLSSLEKYKKSFKRIDISIFLKNVISPLKTTADKKNIRINLINLKDKISVKANPTLLDRAISNIIENAIKYSPEDSLVEVLVEKTETCLLYTSRCV